jgi:hypothetical protein
MKALKATNELESLPPLELEWEGSNVELNSHLDVT